MSDFPKTVQEFMTVQPTTVRPDMSLAQAADLMRERSIRHLPVTADGGLIGVLSERDVHVARTLRRRNFADITVAKLMNDVPLVVAPETPIATVAARMLDRRTGSAVVVHEGRVVGIFTTVDALLALHRIAGEVEERDCVGLAQRPQSQPGPQPVP